MESAWHGPRRYAIEYSMSSEQVTVAKKPHNCDWLAAPLGDKFCHYEAHVEVIRTGHRENSSQRVISFDNGKTWSDDNSEIQLKPAVNVTWSKVERMNGSYGVFCHHLKRLGIANGTLHKTWPVQATTIIAVAQTMHAPTRTRRFFRSTSTATCFMSGSCITSHLRKECWVMALALRHPK